MTLNLLIRSQEEGDGKPLQVVALRDSITSIGRDAASSVRLDDPAVAPEQAVIIIEGDDLLFINREAGTIFNGEKLARETRLPLAAGDELHIGTYILSVADDSPHDSADSVALAPSLAANLDSSSSSLVSPDLSGDDRSFFQQGEDSGASRPFQSNSKFAAILDSLRTEEDTFHFRIETGTQAGTLIPIERAEMPLGWDDSGQNLSANPTLISTLCAVVRKDWSGVVLQSQAAGAVTINGETIETVRRLREADRVVLARPTGKGEVESPSLVFHEPASLLVLDSLLPQPLPQPVSADAANELSQTSRGDTATDTSINISRRDAEGATIRPRRYLANTFSLLELGVLAAGTLLATLVVYLLLHFLA